ncbi:hypothetical protein FACS189465_0780 [Clostridia bacterium]|nr:hypothetical protein FACS189465_0780 [Clostridia bacterium]
MEDIEKNFELSVCFNETDFSVEQVPARNKNYYFDKDLFKDFKKDKFKTLYNFAFCAKDDSMSDSLIFLYSISDIFIHEIAHDSEIEITRKIKPIKNEICLKILHIVPFAVGIEYININWIKNIWQQLCNIFYSEVSESTGSISEYLKSKGSDVNTMGRVFFHLVENKDEECPFAFLATYCTGTQKKLAHLPLKNALIEYKNNKNKLLALLSTVSQAAKKSEFISELVESGELFSPLKFAKEEAYTFLKEIGLYEECGIICRIPNWWKQKNNTKLSVTIGEKPPSMVGLDALISFEPEIHLGDISLTKQEIQDLLAQTSGLAFIKGKWIEVEPQKLKEVINLFDNMENQDGISISDALRMQLNLGKKIDDNLSDAVEITNGEWLESVKNKLIDPSQIKDLEIGEEFDATLRKYQQAGVNWLNFMKELNFGALLADDMGLGKTVQILAFLEYLRKNKNFKTLLIVPASLVCNWSNEIKKFTPELEYFIIDGKNKIFDINSANLFIVTYTMTLKTDSLLTINWDLIVLDEAQAIKNPATKQSKRIKEISSAHKIAMTGTPIENRLSDLWSIFDFLNKGLLGTSKEFTDYAKSLKDDSSGYAKLRNIINPFILRRLKTDKQIISDLPEKIEVKAFTKLSKKQTVLYTSLVKELKATLENDEMTQFTRKGIILASIMKFKQICNHPDQYLGQQEYKHEYSGKFEKLREICSIIYEKRERVIVFTQFKEMTLPIANFLEKYVFESKNGLILHGSTPIKSRGDLVTKFNGEDYVPFMVLSLKAGGVGLNLTSANHVIHFDRWWNPAIENQATDRAFRIGQKKNVMVHKFVTTGTIEEKIDKMLEEKQRLSSDIIVSTGESWITNMENNDLIDLLKLEA